MVERTLRAGFVILNYNDYYTTANLIQKMRKDGIEDLICVVDNCSTDNSYIDLKKLKMDNYIVLRGKSNGGYAFGNNIGCRYLIEECKVDIIFIANPDVVFSKKTVDKMMEMFIQYNEYAVLTPLMYKPDGNLSSRPYIRIPSYSQDLMSCFFFYNRIYERKYPYNITFSSNVIEVEAAPGSFFAIRAATLEQIGYMDEGTFLYYEEIILAMKIKNGGGNWKIGLVPSLNYIHHHSVSIRNSMSVMNSYCIYMNSKIYFEKKYHHIGIIKQIILKAAIFISCVEEWGMLLICKKKGKS